MNKISNDAQKVVRAEKKIRGGCKIMSIYRCAACGSKNVFTDMQADGVKYNFTKGAVGTVILGAGGAAAGIESKQQKVYKCPDCGVSLSYAMPEEIKQMIDLGVISREARNNLKLRGATITWDFLKGKYKNIERGTADEAEEKSAEKKLQNIERFNLERSEEYRQLQLLGKDAFIEDLKLKCERASARAEEKQKEIHEEFLKELDEYRNQLLETKDKKTSIEAKIASAQKKLSELGMFKRAQKKEIQSNIDALKHELSEISDELDMMESLGEPEEEKNSGVIEQIIVYESVRYFGALKITELNDIALYIMKNVKVNDLAGAAMEMCRQHLMVRIEVGRGRAFWGDAENYDDIQGHSLGDFIELDYHKAVDRIYSSIEF